MTNPIAVPDALDRWWAQHGSGPRYGIDNGVTVDSAIDLYTNIEHSPVGVGGMTEDVKAGYHLDDPELVACVAAYRARWNAEHTTEHTTEHTPPAAPEAPAEVAPAASAPTSPTTPAIAPQLPTAPLTPGAVVTDEHHAAATSWIQKAEHGASLVAASATPENIDKVTEALTALKVLFGLFRH